MTALSDQDLAQRREAWKAYEKLPAEVVENLIVDFVDPPSLIEFLHSHEIVLKPASARQLRSLGVRADIEDSQTLALYLADRLNKKVKSVFPEGPFTHPNGEIQRKNQGTTRELVRRARIVAANSASRPPETTTQSDSRGYLTLKTLLEKPKDDWMQFIQLIHKGIRTLIGETDQKVSDEIIRTIIEGVKLPEKTFAVASPAHNPRFAAVHFLINHQINLGRPTHSRVSIGIKELQLALEEYRTKKKASGAKMSPDRPAPSSALAVHKL